jgi:hypothetical protein
VIPGSTDPGFFGAREREIVSHTGFSRFAPGAQSRDLIGIFVSSFTLFEAIAVRKA